MTMRIADGACTEPASRENLPTSEACEMPACIREDIRQTSTRTSIPRWTVGVWSQVILFSLYSKAVTCELSLVKHQRVHLCIPVSRLFSKCSASCGTARRTRTVTCVAQSAPCNLSDKPEAHETCDLGPCLAKSLNVVSANLQSSQWLFTEWSDQVRSLVRSVIWSVELPN